MPETPNEARVLNTLDQMRPEIVAFLQELLRRPSENHPPGGDEGPCQEFVAEALRRLGLEVDVFEPTDVPGIEDHQEWLPGRDYRGRPNVVGLDPGLGGGRGLLILAHVDVELAGPRELWRHDPWAGEVEDGQVYGRGANDDKSGIAAVVMALEALRRCGLRPRGRLAFASVVDEEQGGGNGTLACLLRGYTAEAGLYADGLGLRGELAYLGGGAFRLHARQMGDYRPAADTLAYLGAVCRSLEAFGEQRLRDIHTFPGYEDNTAASRGCQVAEVRAGDTFGDLARAGELDAWVYALPNEEAAADTLAALRRHLDADPAVGGDRGFAYDLQWVGRFLHASTTPESAEIVQCLAGAFHAATGRSLEMGSAEMSDQPLMNRFGAYPTVGFGVGRWLGEGAAHLPDEAVAIDSELMLYVKTLALVIMRWCGYGSA